MHLGTVTQRLVDPTSPVLLTRNGPLRTSVHLARERETKKIPPHREVLISLRVFSLRETKKICSKKSEKNDGFKIEKQPTTLAPSEFDNGLRIIHP